MSAVGRSFVTIEDGSLLVEMLVTVVIVVLVLLTAASSILSVHRVQAHSGAYREMTDALRLSANLVAQDARQGIALTAATDQLLDIRGPVDITVQYEFQPSFTPAGVPIPGEVTLWRVEPRTYNLAPLADGLSDASRFEDEGNAVRMYLVTAAREGMPSQTMTTLFFPQGSQP